MDTVVLKYLLSFVTIISGEIDSYVGFELTIREVVNVISVRTDVE